MDLSSNLTFFFLLSLIVKELANNLRKNHEVDIFLQKKTLLKKMKKGFLWYE